MGTGQQHTRDRKLYDRVDRQELAERYVGSRNLYIPCVLLTPRRTHRKRCPRRPNTVRQRHHRRPDSRRFHKSTRQRRRSRPQRQKKGQERSLRVRRRQRAARHSRRRQRAQLGPLRTPPRTSGSFRLSAQPVLHFAGRHRRPLHPAHVQLVLLRSRSNCSRCRFLRPARTRGCL